MTTETATLENLTTAQLNIKAVGRLMLAYTFDGDGIGAPGRVILQQRESGDYCVHWQNRQNGGCCDGHYTPELGAALADFADRVKREEVYANRRGDKPGFEAFHQVGDEIRHVIIFA